MVVNLKTGEASKVRILVVAADPTASSNEHLEDEANVIREALGQGQNIQPEIHLVNTLARHELFETCERFRPDLIDITSHGSPSQKMLLEGQGGWVRNITGNALVQGLKKQLERLIACFLTIVTFPEVFGRCLK